jgi:large subunit ribosomal protein L21
MFAVIKTGGKQYRVAANDVITIEKLSANAGDVIAFDHVLMLGGETPVVGTPAVAGACVSGTVVEQTRGPKTINFKKRRRQNSRRKKGHRQHLTIVRIEDILTNGARPALTARAAPVEAHSEAHSETAVDAGIAAGAAAAVAAAVAAGLDTSKFQKLEKAVGTADDITLIGGIGPTIGKKLNALGIWHFWQVAAMQQADIEAVEAEVGFKGRAERDEWKLQAQELMAGKPPRAKVDQATAKK